MPSFEESVSEMSFKGLRTIALGWKSVDNSEVGAYLNKDREEFLRNIEMLGVVTFSNALKDDTLHTISTLQRCGINTRMITGDNVFVAVEVAFQSGILDQQEPVLVLSGGKFT